MLRDKRFLWFMSVIALFAIVACAGVRSSEKVQPMSIDALKDRLSDGTAIVLDVRTGTDWSSSDRKIKGARRVDPNDVDTWAGALSPNETLVFYCA